MTGMTDIKLLRHYIFINPVDVFEDINKNAILNDIKQIHNKIYTNGEIVKYYGYNDIVNLLNNYDNELCNLFKELNYNYPALLADIGRYIILYNYGGVYHDLKCISHKKMFNYLNSISNEIKIIGQTYVFSKEKVQNTNIVILEKHSKFLNDVLQKIKMKLINSKDSSGPCVVLTIGMGTYMDNFPYNTKNAIKISFGNEKFVEYNSEIYSKNITKWQNTNEYIFREKHNTSPKLPPVYMLKPVKEPGSDPPAPAPAPSSSSTHNPPPKPKPQPKTKPQPKPKPKPPPKLPPKLPPKPPPKPKPKPKQKIPAKTGRK